MTRRAFCLRPRTPAGFTLLEMLFCVLLLPVALLLAARLFTFTMKTYHDAPEALRLIRTQQAWLNQLRADARAATRIETRADGTLELLLDNGQPVRWLTDDGLLRREAGDDLVGDMEFATWPLRRAMRAEWSAAGVLTIHVDTSAVPLATPTHAAIADPDGDARRPATRKAAAP